MWVSFGFLKIFNYLCIMEILLMIVAYLLIYLGADIKIDENNKVDFIKRELFSTEWIVHVALITLGGIILVNLK